MAKKSEAKPTHRVLSPLRHNGDLYGVGEPIALADEEAAPLLDPATGPTVEPLKTEKKPDEAKTAA